MNKKIKYIIFSIVCIVSVVFAYAFYTVGFVLKDEYALIDGGNLNKVLPYFVSVSDSGYMPAANEGKITDGVVKNTKHREKLTLKLFNIIPIKEVSVNVIESPSVVPSGECIGVKLYARGIITVGLSDFKTKKGDMASPAKNAGMRPGDIIKSINGTEILNISQFSKFLDQTMGECEIGVIRKNEDIKFNVIPKLCDNGHNKIGAIVRDSTAGIGTMTYYEKNSLKYAALGHGISDNDTDIIIPVKEGRVYAASILGIVKGKKGSPGEIMGAVNEEKYLGDCTYNSTQGIYGKLFADFEERYSVKIASKSQVQKGKAKLLCTLDDSGPQEYEMEIVNISRMRNNDTKSMIIKVTDRNLLRKTGGIVQGMSGSPIIQKGKLVGAVTHVFVNDPTKGYGIFIENMLSES